VAIGAVLRGPTFAAHPRRRWPPWPLVLAAAAVGTLAILPVAYLVIRALGADEEAISLLVRPRTIQLLVSSTVLAGGVGIGAVLLGVPIAWLTTRTDLPGRRVWTVLAVAPVAIPSYVLAFAFVAALGPSGALQDLLEPLGIDRLPSAYGLPAALLVLTLATYPYVVLAARSALLRADPTVEEAARSLGDDAGRVFRRVTIPLIAPAVGAGGLLAALYAISDFGAVSILRFDSFARAIHVQYRSSFDRSGGAALALLLIAATFILVWAETRARRRAARTQHAAQRSPTVVRLGRWRWPSLAACGAVCGSSLGLPAVTVVYWLARSRREIDPIVALLEPARDSLVAASSAALLAAAIALPVAILVVRYPGRLSATVERLTYGAYAVPGICLALAVVFFTLNVVPALYQTLAVLVLAYAIRFLPQATATTRGALMLIGPRLPEAARSLGESPLGVLRSVTLPLLRPGLLAGAALVFMSTIKELPLTLLVAPTGFGTLATQVWDAAGEGFFARAAAPAALLMIISIGSVALLVRGEARP
jgi:iron(III) transport system permease protein